ncbi:MAG: WG repeat-containing protein [Saprospiraceae bacterium]
MGLAVVRYGSDNVKYGLINLKGEMITSQRVSQIRPFKEGMAAVRTKDGYGFVNLMGEQVVKDIFSKVSDFSEGKQLFNWKEIVDTSTNPAYVAEPQFFEMSGLQRWCSSSLQRIKNAGYDRFCRKTLLNHK